MLVASKMVKINLKIIIMLNQSKSESNINTVKPVYNDHSWDPKIVVVIDRWSLFRGAL